MAGFGIVELRNSETRTRKLQEWDYMGGTNDNLMSKET